MDQYDPSHVNKVNNIINIKVDKMKKVFIAIIVVAAFLETSLVHSAIAADPVHVYAIAIPGLHQKDGNGEYDKILKSLPDVQVSIKVYPPKRAFYMFAKDSSCCISPANTNPEFYEWDSNVVQTKAMNTAKIYIFSPKGKPAINELAKLKNKRVGIRSGMPYGASFDAMNLQTEEVNTIEQNINKLDAGRIDYMVAYVPDAYAAFKKMGIEVYPHDKDNPLAVHDDSLICKNISDDLIQKINAGLTK